MPRTGRRDGSHPRYKLRALIQKHKAVCKLNKGVKRRSHDQQTGSFVIWRSSLAIGRLGVGSEQSDFRCKRTSDLGAGDPAQITLAKVLSPSIALNTTSR